MLKKRYIKSRKVCKVTFDLPEAVEAESVYLVGEFNDWDASATPMTRRKGGLFRVTLELEPGREYQFRYLVNGQHWCNDWHADAYTPSGFGEHNCVVVTPAEASAARYSALAEHYTAKVGGAPPVDQLLEMARRDVAEDRPPVICMGTHSTASCGHRGQGDRWK